MPTKRISIAPRVIDKITVDLAGKEYLIDTPKATLGLIMADRMAAAGENTGQVLVELQDWITQTFGKKEGPKVYARLTDPADPVDIMQIVELIQQLTEAATPNPTT